MCQLMGSKSVQKQSCYFQLDNAKSKRDHLHNNKDILEKQRNLHVKLESFDWIYMKKVGLHQKVLSTWIILKKKIIKPLLKNKKELYWCNLKNTLLEL